MRGMGRYLPTRIRPLNVWLQYIQDIQRLMLKVVFRVVSRPLGKSYIGLTLDFFRFPTSLPFAQPQPSTPPLSIHSGHHSVPTPTVDSVTR